ncbi:MAG: P1 family peptidase [Candidatus Carbobacillus altaicus]|nr:P1 family peptidase [Candidatus Carbobacillus altaicus]
MPESFFETITDVPGVLVGQIEDEAALTGVSVVWVKGGAVAGVSVRGHAPATREIEALSPDNLVDKVHAVVLSGGSAFGLDAASGVMQFLEESGEGFDTGLVNVPIVPAAALFDLAIGRADLRPDRGMGYAAMQRAGVLKKDDLGNRGAGTGATVGKLFGMARAMKSGIGSYARRYSGGLVIGALIAVNAVGVVYDETTREVLAGVRSSDGQRTVPLDELYALQMEGREDLFPGTATTIGVVATNARLSKIEAARVADMAHGGLIRSIYPVHTQYDGDTLFALSTGDASASADWVGTLAQDVVAETIRCAVRMAKGAGGLPAFADLKGVV